MPHSLQLNQTLHAYHRLTHRIPSGCDPSHCDYFLAIDTNPNNNDGLLDFTLEGTARGWLAVGFSKTPNMVCTVQEVLPTGN